MVWWRAKHLCRLASFGRADALALVPIAGLSYELCARADCPCHGSIFTKEGKCINGPAVEDLRPVKIGAFGVKSDDEAAVAQGGKTF